MPYMKTGPRLAALLVAALSLSSATAAAGATPARYEIDPERSEAGFVMQTTWHGVEGRTKAVSGAIVSESGDLFADGRVSVVVQAAQLDTGNERRDKVMREDELETSRYPTIEFNSTRPPTLLSTVRNADGGYTEVSLTLEGNLSVHGVTRATTVAVTARRDGEAWVMTGEVPVRLTDHKIPDPSIFLNHVQDEVKVVFSLRTKPPSGPG